MYLFNFKELYIKHLLQAGKNYSLFHFLFTSKKLNLLEKNYGMDIAS